MSFLADILADTRTRVAARKARVPQQELESRARALPAPPDFAASLRRPGIRVIAELKSASPSRGVIRADYPVAVLARQLEANGAAALSILTEESRFHGSLADLETASASVKIPRLRKDFIVDPYQIVEARTAGASAVLLIAAALEKAQLAELAACAAELGLAVLAEAHDAKETAMLVEMGLKIIGVNSRNLATFVCTPKNSAALLQMIPRDRIAVAESSITSRADIDLLAAAGARAFLIGETLMRAADPGARLAELLK